MNMRSIFSFNRPFWFVTFVIVLLTLLFLLKSNTQVSASVSDEPTNNKPLGVPPPTPKTQEEESNRRAAVRVAQQADAQPAFDLSFMAAVPCREGFAGQYPCQNVDLMSFLPLSMIGGGKGADLWGWTDAQTGKEYAIMTRTNGTAFVEISDPENPIYLGNLPSHTHSSIWRDAKVYQNHAFIVADVNGNHGVQIFDLTQLRDITSSVTFTETAHYDNMGSAHNIVINEETGYAYAVDGDVPHGPWPTHGMPSRKRQTCHSGVRRRVADLKPGDRYRMPGYAMGHAHSRAVIRVVHSTPEVNR